jgi:acyl carrier protein
MEAAEKIQMQIAETLGIDSATIRLDDELSSLVSSSFLLVELVIELQEEFSVRFDQADLNTVQTVADLVDLVSSRMAPQS